MTGTGLQRGRRGDPGVETPQRRARADHRNTQGGNVFPRAGERPAQPPLTSSVCEFIANHRDRFGVAPICCVLSEHGVPIAPRTFYADLSCGFGARNTSRVADAERMEMDLRLVGTGGRRDQA